MKTPLFTGACTALVTPFENGKINFPMLETLLQRQMDAGIGTVVLCGTTGESPTLSDEEKLAIFRHAKTFVGTGCTIIAGTGSNSTHHVMELSRSAEEAGADALLVVTPYYNKATPSGLYAHYRAIAAAVHIPVILYNVPGRTGIDIPVEIYQQLAQIPNICGVKEASTDITKISKIKALCPEEFAIWSGNDDMTIPVIAAGGCGVISVASNVVPEQMQAMVQAALAGKFRWARKLHQDLLPLIELLFCEVNPIPVKAAMALLGYDCGDCRLPLTPLLPEHQAQLKMLLSGR
ncbi:MAG: 4-hydroxy-tetrahydrodipicolinate synthase [Faecousia sp.]